MMYYVKKTVTLLVSLLLVAGLLAGCTSANTPQGSSQASQAGASSETVSQAPQASSSSGAASSDAGSQAPGTVVDIATLKSGDTLGEGSKVFVFSVVDAEGTEIVLNIKTDAATVGEALVALGLIEGEDSQYGLYVTTVLGTTVRYEDGGKYWAFYENGEYAATGVDATDIVDGTTYQFRVE